MISKRGNHILGLDHLRALAALLVFYWHGIHSPARGLPTSDVPRNWVASLFEEGWAGVSLFIVITGFVFTVITHDKDINYFGFLKNRLLRLLPLIFLVTLYGVYAEGASNQSLLIFFSLLGGGAVYGTWTLVVEFQFYVSYPYLRDTLVRKSALQTFAACGLLCSLFIFLRLAYFLDKGNAQEVAFWTILGQADAFLAGILAGLTFLHFRKNPPKARISAIVLAACVLSTLATYHWFNATGGFYHRPDYPSSSMIWVIWPTITAVLWASVVASYCMVSSRASGRISRWFAYLGAISYSTYMLHFLTVPAANSLYDTYIAIQFFDHKRWNETAILFLFHYPLTILVSIISYELIEKAFLKRKTRYLIDRHSVEDATPRLVPATLQAAE